MKKQAISFIITLGLIAFSTLLAFVSNVGIAEINDLISATAESVWVFAGMVILGVGILFGLHSIVYKVVNHDFS